MWGCLEVICRLLGLLRFLTILTPGKLVVCECPKPLWPIYGPGDTANALCAEGSEKTALIFFCWPLARSSQGRGWQGGLEDEVLHPAGLADAAAGHVGSSERARQVARCPVSPWLSANLRVLDHGFLRARDGGDPMKMMICDNQSQQLVFWLTGLFCFLSPRQNVTNKSSPAFAY